MKYLFQSTIILTISGFASSIAVYDAKQYIRFYFCIWGELRATNLFQPTSGPVIWNYIRSPVKHDKFPEVKFTGCLSSAKLSASC